MNSKLLSTAIDMSSYKQKLITGFTQKLVIIWLYFIHDTLYSDKFFTTNIHNQTPKPLKKKKPIKLEKKLKLEDDVKI